MSRATRLLVYVPTAYLPRATLLEQLTAAGGIVSSACTCAGLELRHSVLHRAADLAGEVRVVKRVLVRVRVQGLGFRVQGLGFRVWGLGLGFRLGLGLGSANQTQPHVPPRAELVELHPAVTARVQARHDLGVQYI